MIREEAEEIQHSKLVRAEGQLSEKVRQTLTPISAEEFEARSNALREISELLESTLQTQV